MSSPILKDTLSIFTVVLNTYRRSREKRNDQTLDLGMFCLEQVSGKVASFILVGDVLAKSPRKVNQKLIWGDSGGFCLFKYGTRGIGFQLHMGSCNASN